MMARDLPNILMRNRKLCSGWLVAIQYLIYGGILSIMDGASTEYISLLQLSLPQILRMVKACLKHVDVFSDGL